MRLGHGERAGRRRMAGARKLRRGGARHAARGDRPRRRHARDPGRRPCRQADHRPCAGWRICPRQPASRRRGQRHPGADDQQRRRRAAAGRIRQISAARATLLGAADRAAVERPRRDRLSPDGQRDGPGDRDDRDPGRARCARRYSRCRRDRRSVCRPLRPLDRLERRRERRAARRGADERSAAGRERAKAHGKYAAMFCFDGADARAMLALGYRLCTIASDHALMRAAAQAELAAARADAPESRRRRWKKRNSPPICRTGQRGSSDGVGAVSVHRPARQGKVGKARIELRSSLKPNH